MTTIKKIAEVLGLSPATISLALNGSPLISEKTRKKVQDKAEELDYIPNNFGRGLQSKSSRLIGYMCNTPVHSFNAEIMEVFGLQAAQNKYGMVLGVAGDNFENFDKLFQLFLEKNVDAIVLALDTIFEGTHFSYFMEKITKRKLPVLACASEIVNADIPFVGINECQGAYISAEYLLKIGHRHLLCPSKTISPRRRNGYIAACRKYEVPEPFWADEPQEIVSYVLRHKEITGILCSSDLCAIQVLALLKDNGVKVPDDVSVIGFDDIWFAARPEYSLTTVIQHRLPLGELAFSTILKMINGEEIIHDQFIEPELILRSTTGWPKRLN